MTDLHDSVNLRSPSPSPQGLTNDDGVGVQSVDGVSDSPYTSSKFQTDGQPLKSGNDSGKAVELSEVGRGLPSNDDLYDFLDRFNETFGEKAEYEIKSMLVG